MDWFERLVGFPERSPRQVRGNLTVDGEYLHSKINGRRIRHGRLDIPSLAQLRCLTAGHAGGAIRVREIVGDVRELHELAESAGATFQVASQFNLLEMSDASITPSMGVGIYEMDATQGPACAVACGGGTIYRNYFAIVDGVVGQTEGVQIDTVEEFGEAVGNGAGEVWGMRNGWALGKERGLRRADGVVRGMGEGERDGLRALVRVGVQYGVEVTSGGGGHSVTQVYAAGFPVGYEYTGFGKAVWEGVARVLLEGMYEATLRAAVVNMMNGGSDKVYLTLVGGGVFGNEIGWIVDGMRRAFEVMSDGGLDVYIVSYRGANAAVGRVLR